jgi:hypothetical protein
MGAGYGLSRSIRSAFAWVTRSLSAGASGAAQNELSRFPRGLERIANGEHHAVDAHRLDRSDEGSVREDAGCRDRDIRPEVCRGQFLQGLVEVKVGVAGVEAR